MVVELERAEALGIEDVVSHPGAHVGSGEDAGLARIAAAIDEVHRRTRGLRVRIALETTAGQGSCLGCRFEHLGRIIDLVAEPERTRRVRRHLPYFRRGVSPGDPNRVR